MSLERSQTRTTTVRLPRSVYEEAKRMVEEQRGGSGGSVSLNDFIVSAIKTYLKVLDHRRIDAAFAGMAEDAGYQKEAALLAEGFEHSDWEALKLELSDLEGEISGAADSAR